MRWFKKKQVPRIIFAKDTSDLDRAIKAMKIVAEIQWELLSKLHLEKVASERKAKIIEMAEIMKEAGVIMDDS